MFKKCLICNNNFKVKPSHYKIRITCSKKCQGKLCSINYSGKNNPAYGKVYHTKATHPEWAEKIKNSTKGKVNLGDSNGMKRPEVREKMRISRRKMLDNEEVKSNIAAKTRKAWVDGKYEGARVGQCKWFDYQKSNGEIIKVQGTWELAFAKWADKQGIIFTAHRGRLSYIDDDDNKRSYYPDFYVEDWKCWVDIKNDYHYNLQRNKIENIIKSNPNEKIKFLLKNEMINLGIEF